MSMSSTIGYEKKGIPNSLYRVGISLFAVGLIAVILGYLTDSVRSAFNNVILLMLLESVGLGALFIIALEHIAGAVWSTPFRRIFEFLASTILILPLVFIPIYFNMHDIFHWMHQSVVENDAILSSKSAYLNQSFFLIRWAIYYIIWVTFYFLFTRNSKKQDTTNDPKYTKWNIKLAAAFIPLFALSISFSAIDMIMSLEPHWFSTIFGVYYFSSTVLTSLAAGTFLMVYLTKKGYLFNGINQDHYYSFGALLFAFVNFWAYIAFSQYLLIWYGNLPEETSWFLHRWSGSWVYFSIFFLIVHFVVPYAFLLAQPAKMNPKRLSWMSIWIFLATVVDLMWLILPAYSPEGFVFGWIEIGFIILGVGIVLTMFSIMAKKENLIPIGDPKLLRGINFRL